MASNLQSVVSNIQQTNYQTRAPNFIVLEILLSRLTEGVVVILTAIVYDYGNMLLHAFIHCLKLDHASSHVFERGIIARLLLG